MAEVFTISGAPAFGQMIDPSLRQIDQQNRGAGGASGAPPPVQLQNALVALGNTAGDSQLANLKIDGIIGSGTVKAVNLALAKYIGSTQYFPRADLTLAKVRQYAGGLAQLVTARVQKSGGTVPPPPAVSHGGSHRGGHSSDAAAAQAAIDAPLPGTHPNLVWWIGGGAVVVLALGFLAHRKRQTAPA